MSDEKPVLQINQNLIVALAIGASILAIVLYYENKKMREQFMPKRQPCNCHEHNGYLQTTPATRVEVRDTGVYAVDPMTNQATRIDHSDDPAVMPNGHKPPEVVVD